MKKYSWAFLIMALLMLVACSAGGSASSGAVESVDDLVGIWEQMNAPGYAVYNQYFEDGTFRCAHELQELDENASCSGDFWFEEGLYHEIEYEALCPSSMVGVYEIQRLESGNIKFTIVEDDCPPRVLGLYGAGEFEGEVEYRLVQ